MEVWRKSDWCSSFCYLVFDWLQNNPRVVNFKKKPQIFNQDAILFITGISLPFSFFNWSQLNNAPLKGQFKKVKWFLDKLLKPIKPCFSFISSCVNTILKYKWPRILHVETFCFKSAQLGPLCCQTWYIYSLIII